MASQSSQQQQQSQNPMEVDENGRKRREREATTEEEEQLGGEKEPHTPPGLVPAELSIRDLFTLMTKSMNQNEAGFSKLDQDMTTLKRDVKAVDRKAEESRIMAAKATTAATEAKQSLVALEQRVSQLEQGKIPQAAPAGRYPGKNSPQNQSKGGRDWDQIGGEEGDTAVVQRFSFLVRQRRET